MFIDVYSHIQYHSQKDERWWKMFLHSKLSMLCFQILNPHLSTVGSSLSFFCNPNALPGIQSKKSLWFLIDVPWDFIHCGNHHFTTGWWWLEPWNGLWLSRNSWECHVIPTDEVTKSIIVQRGRAKNHQAENVWPDFSPRFSLEPIEGRAGAHTSPLQVPSWWLDQSRWGYGQAIDGRVPPMVRGRCNMM